MAHVAEACGVGREFAKIGEYIHKDDLHHIRLMLDVTEACMEILFAETDFPFTD